MANKIEPIAEEIINQEPPESQQIMLMGGAIAGLNLLLMVFVCLYWTNGEFHIFITGKPL